MIVKSTNLEGVFVIENTKFVDHRGLFVKTFHQQVFKENGLEYTFQENFYSVSKKGVLRGMHFQLPPHDHAKLVYVTHGEILDVVLDIRKKSSTFGKTFSVKLSDENSISLYIEKGFAHGFLTLSDSATVVYLTSTVHNPVSDSGVRWNSFNYEWPVKDPIMSERDSTFIGLNQIA